MFFQAETSSRTAGQIESFRSFPSTENSNRRRQVAGVPFFHDEQPSDDARARRHSPRGRSLDTPSHARTHSSRVFASRRSRPRARNARASHRARASPEEGGPPHLLARSRKTRSHLGSGAMASASTVVARLVQLNDGGADDRAFDIRDKELTIGRCAPSRGRRRRRVVARGVVSGVPGTRAKRSRRAVWSSPRAGEQTRDPRAYRSRPRRSRRPRR